MEGRNVLNSGFLSANKLPRGELAGFLFDWYETGYVNRVAINMAKKKKIGTSRSRCSRV